MCKWNVDHFREDMRDYGDQYVPKFYNGWIPSPNPPVDNRMAMEEAVANQRRQVEGRYMEDRARQEVGEGDYILCLPYIMNGKLGINLIIVHVYFQQSDWSIDHANISGQWPGKKLEYQMACVGAQMIFKVVEIRYSVQ